jgi:hypothetical protein
MIVNPHKKEIQMIRSQCMLVSSLLLMATIGTGGCSWIFVNAPPNNHESLPYFDCTSSNAAPVLDTIWGALNAIGAISAAATPDEKWNYATSKSSTMIVGLLWTAVMIPSAIYGYSNVSKCNQAKERIMLRQYRSQEPSPLRKEPSPPNAEPPPPATPAPLVKPRAIEEPPPIRPPAEAPQGPSTPESDDSDS